MFHFNYLQFNKISKRCQAVYRCFCCICKCLTTATKVEFLHKDYHKSAMRMLQRLMHCNDHICRTWISYYIEYNNVHCMNEMKNHRFLCGIILLKIISFSSLANCILCYFRNAKMSFEITRNKKISECIYASINFIYLTYFTKTFTSSEKP